MCDCGETTNPCAMTKPRIATRAAQCLHNENSSPQHETLFTQALDEFSLEADHVPGEDVRRMGLLASAQAAVVNQ